MIEKKYITVLHLLIITLLPIIVYFKVTGFSTTDFDDTAIITTVNTGIGDISKLDEAFKKDVFLGNPPCPFYRPIQTVTYAIDSFISDTNPWMFHCSNLIIHIVTCITLYFFLISFKFKNVTAFYLTLIFSVHPLLTAAIAWLPSRGDLLIGLLGLLLFISFNNYFRKGKKIHFVLHAIIFFLIVFSKETTILFPLLLLFYYYFILKEKINKDYKPKLLPFIVLWILIPLVYIVARNFAVISNVTGDNFGLFVFIKNLAVLIILPGKFFIPYNLSTLPLIDLTSIVIGIIIFILFLFLILTVLKNNNKYSKENRLLVIMGFGWFFLFIIPPMFYRLTLSEYFYTYLEHRTYLPVIGLIIVVAVFLDKIIELYKKLYVILVFVPVILLFAFITYLHADDFKDNLSFLSSGINANSNNAGASLNRGIIYFNNRDYQNALTDFNNVLEVHEHRVAYYYRGLIEHYLKNDISAEADYNKALKLDSTFTLAYISRSAARFILKKYDESLDDLYKAEKLEPENAEIYNDIGFVLISIMKNSEAIPYLSKAISLNPQYYNAYDNRGMAKLNLKDYLGAIDDFNISIQLNGKTPQTFNNLGCAYREIGKLDEAMASFDNAIRIADNFAPAYYERGIAKQKKNDLTGACNDWNTALKLGYYPAEEMINKYCKSNSK